jgi:hypothetical protein
MSVCFHPHHVVNNINTTHQGGNDSLHELLWLFLLLNLELGLPEERRVELLTSFYSTSTSFFVTNEDGSIPQNAPTEIYMQDRVCEYG